MPAPSKTQIAILGSEGQLGSALGRILGERRALMLSRAQLDITNANQVQQILSSHDLAAVINCAAYTKVDLAEQEQALCQAINADAVALLAEACNRHDLPLVQVSSDYVFGADTTRTTPYSEEDPTGPQGVYAQSKLDGERAAATSKRHLIIRTCGLYGPRSRPTQANFVDTMLRLGKDRDRLRIVADQRCTPSYFEDVAVALLFLLEAGANGVFHVVNTGSVTWDQFAAEIFRLAGMSVTIEPISTAEYGAAAARPAYSVLDTTKYQRFASLHGGPELRPWGDALADYLSRIAKPA
ncbi:MAG: dTDP-4-dehydrorhamnose reductase [Planctomycetota bacterium]|nr:dTDP-4-dehydrorhamnose reductase [Planctomycetota bacterium]